MPSPLTILRRLMLPASLAAASAVGLLPGVASAGTPGMPASTAATPASAGPSAAHPCGASPAAAAPAHYAHVIWIIMENKSLSQVLGSPDSPFLNQLGNQCGIATNDTAISHPSLPNYIAMTSGSPQGITDDASPSAHPLAVPSIFSQLGGGWRGLDESMKSNCEQANDGLYAVRHNPAAYYTNIRTVCDQRDIPLTSSSNLTTDLSARFTFITPDVCDDEHDNCAGGGAAGELRTGDAFLASFVPKVLSSPEYTSGTTAVFITFDEGEDATNKVFTVVVAPTVTPGTVSAQSFSHFSMLRTTEEMLHLPLIAGAQTAASMRQAFGI
ncbi:MAG: alkaline phosphatase family protein [Nocardiopsaceae bacterium]|nr:alkaline phosphatase family protein [Nocardiopsaceae bacterium]